MLKYNIATITVFALILSVLSSSCQPLGSKINGKWLEDNPESDKITLYEFSEDSIFTEYVYNTYNNQFETEIRDIWYVDNDTLYRDRYLPNHIENLSNSSLTVSWVRAGKSYKRTYAKVDDHTLQSQLPSLLAKAESAKNERIKREISKFESDIEGLYESNTFGDFYYVDQIRFGNGQFETDLQVVPFRIGNAQQYISGTYRVVSGSRIELYYRSKKIGEAIKAVSGNSLTIYITVDEYGSEYSFRVTKRR